MAHDTAQLAIYGSIMRIMTYGNSCNSAIDDGDLDRVVSIAVSKRDSRRREIFASPAASAANEQKQISSRQ